MQVNQNLNPGLQTLTSSEKEIVVNHVWSEKLKQIFIKNMDEDNI